MNALRTEDDLRAVLEQLAHGAPAPADVLPDLGTDVSRQRRRHWHRIRYLAPAAAGLLVLAVAVGLAAPWRSGRHASGSQAEDLVGIDWRLTSIAGQPVGQALTLTIQPNGRFGQDLGGCSSLQGQLDIAAHSLTINHVQLSLGLCPFTQHDPHSGSSSVFPVLHRMFTGTVFWSIVGDRLTLRNTGTPTLVYTRSPDSAAQTRQWTLHGVGISLPADWPANAEHCGTPVRDTVIFTSRGAPSSCSQPRPPGVTSVAFSDGTGNRPSPAHIPGRAGIFLIDGVKAIERSTPPGGLQTVELDIPSRKVTITITSPSRTEAFELEFQVYITASH